MNTRKYLAAVLTVFLAAGCAKGEAAVNEKTITVSAESVVNMKFTEAELNETYDDATAVHIQLNGTDASADGEGAVCEDTSITITKGGTYVVSGSWEEGQIIVDSEDGEIVHLILNQVSIERTGGPAVYVKNAEETVLTVLTGTTNTISASGENEDGKKGGIYAKDDLAVNGGGNLDIKAQDGDGIHAGDELKLINTIVSIQAESDGMDVNDGLAVKDCILTVKAGKDGIKAGDTDDSGNSVPADIEISGGVVTVTAEDDGIQTTGNLTAENCELNTEAGGGYENAQPHTDEMPGGMFGGFDNENRPAGDFGSFFPQGSPGEGQEGSEGESGRERPGFGMMPEMNGEMPEMNGEWPGMNGERPEMDGMVQEGQQDNNSVSNTETDETETASGIKADGSILLSGTTVSVNSADDAIHTDSDLTINSGTFTIQAGDDGMHADTLMTIRSGEVTIRSCYEGLEAKNLTIEDGTIVITASDDGINIRDGDASTGEFQDDGSVLTINGGSVTVTADGDGIDCNGSGVMNGGEVIVYGPLNSANSALDYNGTFVVNGGTLIAAGSSGMASAPSESSKVNTIEIGITDSSGKIEVKDSSGKTVAEFESGRSFSDLVIASEQFKTGSTYTITQGTETIGEVTISETISYVNRNNGNGMGGAQNPGGFQDGSREQWNGNRKPEMQQKPGSGSEAGDGSEDSGTSEGFSETKPL